MKLFQTSEFMPHGLAYGWQPDALAPAIVANGALGLCMVWLAVRVLVLAFYSREERMVMVHRRWLLVAFAVSLALSGMTNATELLTLFIPVHYLDTAVTAAAALAAALSAGLMQWLVRPEERVAAHELRAAEARHAALLHQVRRCVRGEIPLEQLQKVAGDTKPSS